MVRKTPATFRNPGPLETEIELRRDIRRLRTELQAMRTMEAQRAERDPKAGLSPPGRSTLIRKIARMWDNGVLWRISEADRCAYCGGVTPDQVATAFDAWAEAENALSA